MDLRTGLQFFGSATNATLQFVIALFGLYYMLVSTGASWRRVRGALPFSAASAELLRERIWSVTEAMLIAVLLTAIVQGALIALGFHIVGLRDFAFRGVVTAFASIFPLLGAAAVWMPAMLILLASGRCGAACLGITGLLIGPLALSYFFELLHIYRREYAKPDDVPLPTGEPGPILQLVLSLALTQSEGRP